MKGNRLKMYLALLAIVISLKVFIKPKLEDFSDGIGRENLPPIYVINMEKDTSRMKEITKNLSTMGLRFTRIDAIDGKKLTRERMRSESTWFCGRFCSPQIIGCFLSHKKAWRRVARGKERGAGRRRGRGDVRPCLPLVMAVALV